MKAVVIGATGGLGAALAGILVARGEVTRIGRATTPGLDLLDEASIAAGAGAVGPGLHLVRLGGWYSYRAAKAEVNGSRGRCPLRVQGRALAFLCAEAPPYSIYC